MTDKSQLKPQSLQFDLFAVVVHSKPTRITHTTLTTPMIAGRPVVRYRIANSGNK